MKDKNKSLKDLVVNLEHFQAPPLANIQITGIVSDSRRVQLGNLFVAVCGGTTNGHRFIPDAIERGARAVVGTEHLSGLSVPYIQVKESRSVLAPLAAAFYDFPARKLVMIGITGTDGKTTTANLLLRILQESGIRVGMITTVNALIGDQVLDTGFHVTTPDAPDVQRYLSQMVSAGLTHVILEATSHGLAQHRVDDCEFDMAVVTNITHEHLDFHGTYEAYREAKGRLFTSLGQTRSKLYHPPQGAVLNRDDDSYEYLSGITQVDKLSYGLSSHADVRAEHIVFQPRGVCFSAIGRAVDGKGFNLAIESRLVGEHNLYNCLAAIALARGVLELDDQVVKHGTAIFEGVAGRMERIELGQDFIAVVDFAHTPNSLCNALETARKLTTGRIISVFGSAGLRDRQKRRIMAETSADLADLTILTAEDPRTESLEVILSEMSAGMESRGGVEGESFWCITDRREAIRFALRLARPGDLVIACGKGHEQSMCFGEVEYQWDDRVAVRAALAEILSIPGPEMPFLPT